MKITPELVSELIQEENRLMVLSFYSVYENGNLRDYVVLANKKSIIHAELCKN